MKKKLFNKRMIKLQMWLAKGTAGFLLLKIKKINKVKSHCLYVFTCLNVRDQVAIQTLESR